MVNLSILQTHEPKNLRGFIKEANKGIRAKISEEIKEERKKFSAEMMEKRKIEKEKRIIKIPKSSKKDDLIKIIMDNKEHFKDIIKDKKIKIIKDKKEPVKKEPVAKLGESGIGKKRKRVDKPIKKKVVSVPAKKEESVAAKLTKELFKAKAKAKPKPKPKIPTITITEEEKPKKKVIKVGGRFITPKPKTEPKSTLPPIPKSKIKIRLPTKNIDEEINSVVKVYNEIKKGGVTTPIFEGQTWITKYIFKMILEKHKNDCIYNKAEMVYIGLLRPKTEENEPYLKQKDRYKKYLTPKEAPEGKTYNGGFTKHFIFFSGFNRLLNKYIECKKNKKILCLPITIGNEGGHLNMLIFNYHTQMLERYEPHGAKIKNIGGGYDDDYYNEVIKKIVLFFNDNGEKMRYFPPPLTCPLVKDKNKDVQFAGFQSIEGKAKRYTGEKNNLYNNIVFREGGYCVMWSLWIMDLRLQFPTVPPRKLYTTALNSLNTSESGLYDFIRGFTNSFVIDLNKKLKGYDDIMLKKRKEDKKFTTSEKEEFSKRIDDLFQKGKGQEDFKKTEFIISKPVFKEDTIESLMKAIEYHKKQGNDEIVKKLEIDLTKLKIIKVKKQQNDLKKLKGKAKAKPELESEDDEPDEIPYKDFKLIEGVPKNIKKIFYDYVDDRTGYANKNNQEGEIEELQRVEKNYIKAEETRKNKSLPAKKQFKAVQTIGSILVEVRNDINNNPDLKKLYKVYTPIILKKVLGEIEKDKQDLIKEQKAILKQEKEAEKAYKKLLKEEEKQNKSKD